MTQPDLPPSAVDFPAEIQRLVNEIVATELEAAAAALPLDVFDVPTKRNLPPLGMWNRGKQRQLYRDREQLLARAKVWRRKAEKQPVNDG